jgi:phosphoglycerate dehydrogenase-like enzyme
MKSVVSFIGKKSKEFTELNHKAEEYAQRAGLLYKWVPQDPFNQKEIIRNLQMADAGIIDTEPYSEEVFSEVYDSCKLLVRYGVGYDKVDLKAASKYGIAIARTTGANTLGVAEMAFSLIMAARRKLKYFDQAVARGDWEKVIAGETIQSTIGIVGFGAIGKALAKLFKGWDCRIITYDPFPNKAALDEIGVMLVTLEELFKSADAISLHIPYSSDTHYLVGEKLISLMKPDAVIVNTARGNIIDENALAKALKENRIGGAGLDVFGEEPLPKSSPLIGLSNIVLTSHTSSQTSESLWRIYQMAIDIIADFYNGKESPHILNSDYKNVRSMIL